MTTVHIGVLASCAIYPFYTENMWFCTLVWMAPWIFSADLLILTSPFGMMIHSGDF